MTLEYATRRCGVCGKRLEYDGRGQPPKYCPGACREQIHRQREREYAWQRRRKEGREVRMNIPAPCKEFDKLFKQYTRAGRAGFRTADETPETARAIRAARAAIMQHRATCPVCAYMGDPAPVTKARYPRKTDTVEPLIAIWEAAA